jgi:mono/diheme cytochrome c family protein
MSDPTPPNKPQIEQAAASDQQIQQVHSALLREKPEPQEGYTPMPLFLLGFVSTMIFLVSIYFIHYRAGFDPMVYDERFDPATMGAGAAQVVVVDPMVAGKRLYNQVCATCHQLNGQGVSGAFPPLAGVDWVTGDEATLIRILLHGLQGPIEVKGNVYNGVMPAFGQGSAYNWNDERISHVLTYIRAEWGNAASPITAEQVTAIRTAEPRSAAWTAEALKALQ